MKHLYSIANLLMILSIAACNFVRAYELMLKLGSAA